jgi:hypothetical protein
MKLDAIQPASPPMMMAAIQPMPALSDAEKMSGREKGSAARGRGFARAPLMPGL